MRLRPSYVNRADLEKALRSEKFPYVIAVLQSRVREIPRNSFTINNKEQGIVQKTKEALEPFLDTPVRQSTVKYDGVERHRMWVWSAHLLEFLSFITDNNSKVPDYVFESSSQRANYIRGFFDSRASVSFSGKERKYPRVVITKKNPPLLRSLKHLLCSEGLKPTLRKNVLRLNQSQDIERIIKEELILDPYKMEKLSKLYFTDPFT